MSDQPISLSRADRRKFEKAMRRTPRASRQKPSRADLPLRLIPWNIHGVWAPLDRILAKLEIDGTAEYSGGEPVLYDPGTNDWHNSAQAKRDALRAELDALKRLDGHLNRLLLRVRELAVAPLRREQPPIPKSLLAAQHDIQRPPE